MLLETGPITRLGVDERRSTLRFGEGPKPAGSWAGRRLMWIDGNDQPAFELSYWCGTCPLLFRRMDGATRTLSLSALTEKLATGIDGIDPTVVDAFAALLPAGRYLPMLLRIAPTLVHSRDARDYFTHEQVATWGIDDAIGGPEDPGVAYYRTFSARVDDEQHLYEFVVPMVPPSWNDRDRVDTYGEVLARTSQPTAVAVATLDISQPAMIESDSSDYYAHWALTHFLLDGHHKMHAAAITGRALQVLTLVSVDASLARPEDIERLPVLRRHDDTARPATARPPQPR